MHILLQGSTVTTEYSYRQLMLARIIETLRSWNEHAVVMAVVLLHQTQ